jgi:hypothetical protein
MAICKTISNISPLQPKQALAPLISTELVVPLKFNRINIIYLTCHNL